MAFKAAILRENMHALTYRLEPAIELVDSSNSFEAQQAGKIRIIYSIKKINPLHEFNNKA